MLSFQCYLNHIVLTKKGAMIVLHVLYDLLIYFKKSH